MPPFKKIILRRLKGTITTYGKEIISSYLQHFNIFKMMSYITDWHKIDILLMVGSVKRTWTQTENMVSHAISFIEAQRVYPSKSENPNKLEERIAQKFRHITSDILQNVRNKTSLKEFPDFSFHFPFS